MERCIKYISYFTDILLNQEEQEFDSWFKATAKKQHISLLTGSPDQIDHTMQGKLAQEFAERLDLKEDRLISMFADGFTVPVDIVFIYAEESIFNSTVHFCKLLDLPILNLHRPQIREILRQQGSNVWGFLQQELNQRRKPHGLCLSFGFIPF